MWREIIMKKNKNIVEIIKNNWYFVFLVIPFVTFCIINRTPDNDIWFLMANGRYVLGHGIPYVDTFTIHEGLNYVMQQWLSSVLFYGSFKLFGKFGLLGLMIIVYMLISIVYYNLSLTVSNDKKVALFVTVLIMELSYGFIVTRPQIFTYLILLLELLCIEKYIKNKDVKFVLFYTQTDLNWVKKNYPVLFKNYELVLKDKHYFEKAVMINAYLFKLKEVEK